MQLHSPVLILIVPLPPELPKMESKDIQQLFKDVLGSAEREQQLSCVAAGMEASMGGRDANRAQLSQRPFLQGDLSVPCGECG